MTAVLVVGESVLDEVVDPTGTVRAHPGGSPANVAVGLARLGRDVTLLTELGDDAAGDRIRAHLTEARVTVVSPPAVARTPVARAVIDADGAATYEFSIGWTLATDPTVAVRGGAHVHTGSIAAHLDPGADTVERLVEAAREGATVSYDPNVRAALVGDRAAALARTERLVGLADVVKASDEDLAWLYPGRPLPEVLRAWCDAGPALTVATLGARGMLLCLRGELQEVPAVRTPVVDTVGAGDSSMAALIDGLVGESLLGEGGRAALAEAGIEPVAAVVARAARAAAITVSRAGANPPHRQELDG